MSRSLFVTPVRRAHLIAPFGPGSLLLTRNRVSAVVCAPATWLRSLPERPPGSVPVLEELTITDRHLQAATGVERFVMPWPAGDNPSRDTDWIVPAVRFPLTEACSNPQCQRLVRRDPADASEGRCDACKSPKAKRGRWPTFQTALVLACPAGHLDDVDWAAWLHDQDGPACPQHDVRYRVSAAADRPVLTCNGCSRRVQFDPTVDFPCTGARPWLPHAGAEACTGRARPIERTSTTAYYAWQMSSLTIPVAGADNPALLHALTDNATLRTLRRLTRTPEIVSNITAVATRLGIRTNDEEVTRHLDALEQDQVVGPSRAAELTALLSADHPRRPTGALPDLVVEPQDIEKYRGSSLGRMLSAVSLVPRLRETRVLAGFRRIEPSPPDPRAGYAQLWGKPRPAAFAEQSNDDWLPGDQVFGEGLLFMLDPAEVDAWAARVRTDERIVNAARPALTQNEPAQPLPWLLAHTLAHLVMRAAAPYAGYPLPALRERIFAVDNRTAFLIYTAAGDVHGTLGGLVELGHPQRLGEILEAAAAAAAWCATDPVCGEDAPGPPGRGSTPGACHHCLLVPETCCEAFNHGLDRAVLNGHGTARGFLG
ncbi:DUF1998 domain-containing protein [Mycobacterium sp. SM1]|uniref:DUF1998 domain-containing protein n=1 Tax=Mycobacterium sp. SM1 TaxID=2816243 RepID=UPI001BCB7FDB|nr:DUF1998 domain-containing protein [Mycobacterium sp. SM1]MBS4729855.1 DUF1998 domain-containing protein [Mycobacterium sp. SM1]MBS4730506.1 DUF1998 domain-containing protein [Mycobacterium sp. SM1]